MSLPHFELSSSQYGLLAELVLRPLPSPDGGESAEEEWSVRGLEPEDAEPELSELVFLQLVAREAGTLRVTHLGAAVHHRAVQEAAEERLAGVALLAEAAEDDHPRFARAVRRLAQGTITSGEALAEIRGDDGDE